MLEYLNSDAGKLMTILVAIIVIVLLFLFFGRKQEHTKLHIYYISGLSVFIIIELVTYICVNNYDAKNIVSYISFASTISSLFLSVVAIIYAIVSNNKGEAQYQKIDTASNKISASVDKFSQMSGYLSDKINSILKELGELKVISNETKSAINNNQTNREESASVNLSDQLVDSYISQGSFSGNLAILSCIYAFKQEKFLPLEQLYGENASYCYGYIVATSVLGIISASLNGKVVVVDSVNFEIEDKLRRFLKGYIENTSPADKKIATEIYAVVNKFFGKDQTSNEEK